MVHDDDGLLKHCFVIRKVILAVTWKYTLVNIRHLGIFLRDSKFYPKLSSVEEIYHATLANQLTRNISILIL